MKLRIYVGEHETYREYVENAFSSRPEIDRLDIEMQDIPRSNKIPLGFDIYLLHVSHFTLEQVRELRFHEPGAVVMLRNQNAETPLIDLGISHDGKPLRIHGWYGPSLQKHRLVARGINDDLGQKCLQILNRHS